MNRLVPLLLSGLVLVATPFAHALSGSGVSESAPVGGNDPGWDNVGTVGSGSCVYLGSYATGYWVLSVGHVGVGDSSVVTLGGTGYNVVAGSEFSFTNPNSTTADLILFRISGNASLAGLENVNILSTAPGVGSFVTQIGFGGGTKGWGETTVSSNNGLTTIDGGAHYSYTFQSSSLTVQAVIGDSGGGVFSKISGQWYLSGLMQATGTVGPNYITQSIELSDYRTQINAHISAVPEPSTYALMAGGAGLLAMGIRRRRREAK